MRATDLLWQEVWTASGQRLGEVVDLHVVQDGPVQGSGVAALRLHGLLVGERSWASRLGYRERPGATGPAPVRGPALIRWVVLRRERSRYLSWDQVVEVEPGRVLVRDDARGQEQPDA